ncbi:hypothetical protein AN221_04430 [Streptomyces nanshensis]|uniref:Uncharacterized protein n=1 Tax=Streptomyces nanshensis TaxID=518642 RepID=A0A1E7M0Z2_9ACTN|nr:hypothetical protein AN221_04430 [Streptomyces nanshensis]
MTGPRPEPVRLTVRYEPGVAGRAPHSGVAAAVEAVDEDLRSVGWFALRADTPVVTELPRPGRYLLRGRTPGGQLLRTQTEVVADARSAAPPEVRSTALLYFCGHGVALDGLQHALLLEDFGRAGRNPFEDALDFVRTYEGMRGCAAPVQCYFVDACRELVPFEYLNQLNAWAPASLTNQLHRRSTDLVLYSTGYGQESYAPREGETYFSQAVRAAFAGAGARRGHDGLWRVTTAGLGDGVRELMDHLPHATAPRHGRADAGWADVLQQRAAQDGNPGDAVLRELPGRPKVPFTISCDPHEAQRQAELSLLDLGGEQALRHRPRGDAGPWRGEIEADAYDLLARFPEERWPDERLPREFVVPPSYPRSIPVRLT